MRQRVRPHQQSHPAQDFPRQAPEQRGQAVGSPRRDVMFVLGASVGLTGLLTKDTSGDIGLPPTPGWVGTAPCLAGLLAVALLWRRQRMV
ncbi:PGF-CTERM sorting domain-containing protein [Streptomyces sp. NPDC056309]|uniref:PGF-CTERM sorting domain-containing protein n=2 Tax=unclassified Streptomyces TaxID=2593676 RepID=UPI0035DEE013